MDEFVGTLVIIAGFVFRIGIPVGVTAILAYALRRLDQRWQQEAVDAACAASGQDHLFRRIRCWATRQCPQEKREMCPAFLEKDRPCWQVFRSTKGELRHECLGCPVFRNVPVIFPA